MSQVTICLIIFVLTLIGFALSGSRVSITVVGMFFQFERDFDGQHVCGGRWPEPNANGE